MQINAKKFIIMGTIQCIVIHQDELYIASSTLQEILLIVKDKYKIKINPHIYQGSDFPYDPGGTTSC